MYKFKFNTFLFLEKLVKIKKLIYWFFVILGCLLISDTQNYEEKEVVDLFKNADFGDYTTRLENIDEESVYDVQPIDESTLEPDPAAKKWAEDFSGLSEKKNLKKLVVG